MGMSSISSKEALDKILEYTQLFDEESVSLFNATGRIISESVISLVNVPPADNSAMDGYAVINSDIEKCRNSEITEIKIVGEYAAESGQGKHHIMNGECIRIMTGAPIPVGADTVVPFEVTDEINDTVKIKAYFKKNANIRRMGEDLLKGACIIEAGEQLTPAAIGLIASAGHAQVKVRRQPSVAVVATGNEIVEPGVDLSSRIQAGENIIYNSNAYTLFGSIMQSGVKPVYYGIAPDSIEGTVDLLKRACSEDIIISSGGVSMGRYDFMRDAIKLAGYEIIFDSVRQRPGKPLVFAVKGNKLFFGLPGNPVSTMVGFEEYVRPAILAMQGALKKFRMLSNAICDESIRKESGKTMFLRGYSQTIDGTYHVKTTGPQGSGVLTSMYKSNCLIVLPEEAGNVNIGDSVSIQLTELREGL